MGVYIAVANYKPYIMRKNCTLLLCSFILTFLSASAQMSNTIYGLYRQMTPPNVAFVSLDPVTGLVTPIGNASLSTTINTTGVSLNPYELSYSYQDEDSWLSISLLDGSILSDVTVTLPNTNGDFNNFRFNTADSTMYGLYSQVIYNPTTGTYSGDMRLATCDLSTGAVSLVSPSSIATSYTMAGAVINPHLMVYYFITQGNLRGLDLYNGTIFSDPQITIPSGGNSFDNFAYSCADTTMYGLIMQNGVKCLGKIDVTTGVVTPLPTLLNLDNYVMNAATIDPVNGIYYFETSLAAGITLLGLSLVDGSIVSSVTIPNGYYFDMFRSQSDCFEAAAYRPNPAASSLNISELALQMGPIPCAEELRLDALETIDRIDIQDATGKTIQTLFPNSSSVKISTATLSSGFYQLQISSKQNQTSKRIIVQ